MKNSPIAREVKLLERDCTIMARTLVNVASAVHITNSSLLAIARKYADNPVKE